MDLCGVAIPAGTYPISELAKGETGGSPRLDDGKQLPFGVTVLGGRGRDGMVLEVAQRFEEAMGRMED